MYRLKILMGPGRPPLEIETPELQVNAEWEPPVCDGRLTKRVMLNSTHVCVDNVSRGAVIGSRAVKLGDVLRLPDPIPPALLRTPEEQALAEKYGLDKPPVDNAGQSGIMEASKEP